jgi:hypothetical protein
MTQEKIDAKVDIGQIKKNLADIARRRKEEMTEHKKQLDALDKEEARERKELIKAEAKLLQKAT